MAWLVKKGKHLLHAGTTAADATDVFIKLTKDEPRDKISEAIKYFTQTGKAVKVNGYSIKWE